MKLLLTILIILAHCCCNKRGPLDVSSDIPVTQLPQLIDPYALPTPDSVAFKSNYDIFIESIDFLGINYCGYSTSIKDSIFWETKVAFLKSNTDSNRGYISLQTLSPSKIPTSIIQIRGFELKSGVYTSEQKGMTFYYSDLDDGCSSFNAYKPDSMNIGNVSFFRVISYDQNTKILKGRFKMFLKNYTAHLYPNNQYPETIIIDDGVVYAKMIE
jgi:hypothetical protein